MSTRRLPSPPTGLGDCVSRREAARLLGFGSEFPVRQLEKAGRLRAVRGAMRQAWYPRAEVLALASPLSNLPPAWRTERMPQGVAAALDHGVSRGRWTDSALIALLRDGMANVHEGRGPAVRPRTAVDLVAETGINITRAMRVYRFWLAHDVHPTAALARQWDASGPSGNSSLPGVVAVREGAPPSIESPASEAGAGERRGDSRIERDGLIRALRDPDPAVRARAFEKLRPARKR